MKYTYIKKVFTINTFFIFQKNTRVYFKNKAGKQNELVYS